MTDFDTQYIYIELHMNDTVRFDATCLNIPSPEAPLLHGRSGIVFWRTLGDNMHNS